MLRDGWHFLIPFVVLVGGLLWWNLEAEYAALLATAVLIVLALVVPYKGRRVSPREIISAVVASGGAVVDIIAITAIAGILIGAMNLTGVAFSLTQQLLTISGGSLGLLLIVTAFAAFILGLPLPTVGVYVILATLAAPALVQAGISPMQSHMFVLFNGILGMVTPPVALAAFAAATIAQSDQWKTGWTATRLSWCAYFIPFMFAYSPELVMNGAPLDIILRLAVTLLGIFMGTLAVIGYFQTTVPVPNRIAYAFIALLLLVQSTMFDGAVWANVIGVVSRRRGHHARMAARRSAPEAGGKSIVKEKQGELMRVDAYTHFIPKKFFDWMSEVGRRFQGHRQAHARRAGDLRPRPAPQDRRLVSRLCAGSLLSDAAAGDDRRARQGRRAGASAERRLRRAVQQASAINSPASSRRSRWPRRTRACARPNGR